MVGRNPPRLERAYGPLKRKSQKTVRQGNEEVGRSNEQEPFQPLTRNRDLVYFFAH
jgi:hypothetical protein